MVTKLKGNVICENIKVGDIHYEYGYGVGIKSKVITLPIRNDDGYWHWKSLNLTTGKIIQYGVREGMEHYSPNLYDFEVYSTTEWI